MRLSIVQKNIRINTTADEYSKRNGQEEVKRPDHCPGCLHERLHRHGSYERSLIELGKLLVIVVKRFFCPACRRTTSCLPSFALAYRLMATDTVEAFFEKRMEEAGVAQHWDLLESYLRRWEERASELECVTGIFFGKLSDKAPGERLWESLLGKWGHLQHASSKLLKEFGETALGFYRCHAWARTPLRSMGPLKKTPRLDSS